MPDYRCYCESHPSPDETHIELSPSESNHLIAANRARVGDPVRAFDGRGNEWDAKVTVANKRHAQLEVISNLYFRPPHYRIALAQALPKGKLFESIIRKATEIGAQKVYPILSHHCESKIDSNKAETKNSKWQAAALEGAKQSGNPHLIEIAEVGKFEYFLENSANYELKLIASLTANATSLKTHIANFKTENQGRYPTSAVWLVGPEGDFSASEYEAAASAGFLPTTLGPNVMRSETAAAHALSITRYELETVVHQ